jgi:hypothetical protein
VGDRHVLDGDAEEPGEADRLDVGCDGLQVPAQHLGAYVDAEHGLGAGPGGIDRRCRCRGVDGGGEAPLFGPVEGLLEHEAPFERRPHPPIVRPGPQLLLGLRPRRADIVAGRRLQHGELPAQQHGEELDERIVLPTAQVLLEHDPCRVRRPAPHPEQEPVEVGLEDTGGQCQLPQRLVGRGHRVVGQCPHDRTEPAESHHLGRAVDGGLGLPRREERLVAGRRAPHGLTRVEVGGRPRRHPLGAQVDPVLPRERRRHVGHRGDAGGSGVDVTTLAVGTGGAEEAVDVVRVRSLAGQRHGEVVGADPTVVDRVQVVGDGHRRVRPGGGGQELGGLCEALVGEAQVGVDGDEALERPQGGDAPARGTQHLPGVVEGGGRVGDDRGGHGSSLRVVRDACLGAGGTAAHRTSTAAGSGVVRRPPTTRSSRALA